jgi:hypothetical protein
MDALASYAQVKDIKLMREGSGGSTYRDYAFVEFFSVEDATFVLERAK